MRHVNATTINAITLQCDCFKINIGPYLSRTYKIFMQTVSESTPTYRLQFRASIEGIQGYMKYMYLDQIFEKQHSYLVSSQPY